MSSRSAKKKKQSICQNSELFWGRPGTNVRPKVETLVKKLWENVRNSKKKAKKVKKVEKTC